MSGSQHGNYFEDDTEDGKFTIILFEDPVTPGQLKMEVRLNGQPNLPFKPTGGLSLRPEVDENLARRLANALNFWYDSWPEGED